MRQLHVVMDLAVASGGLGLAALQLSQSLAATGNEIVLLATSNIGTITLDTAVGAPSSFRVVIIENTPDFFSNLRHQYRAINDLLASEKFDLIHLHGVWLPLFVVATAVAMKRKVPYVVSPHGCFAPWALNHKRWKKVIALRTYQNFVNAHASMFFATAEHEVKQIRELGVSVPIALVPNGISIDSAVERPERRERKTILFLSRIHPVKGLLDLVNAWAAVRDPAWRIVVAGPDEDGYQSVVEAAIAAHGLADDFEFRGILHGQSKKDCFSEADLFVLPTYTENFGIVIAEALASGLPVITTTGAPWQDIERYGCGWWVDPGVAGLSEALNVALKTSIFDLRVMGMRGRALVMEKYDLLNVAYNANECYRWMIGQSAPSEKLNFV